MKTIPIRIAGAFLFATIIVAGLNAQPRYRGTTGQGPDSGQNQNLDLGQGEDWSGPGQGWNYHGNQWRGRGQGWHNHGNQWRGRGQGWHNQGNQWGGRGQGWHNQGNQWGGRGQGRMARQVQLDLSDEQKATLKQLKMDHYKATRPLKNKMLELKASERTLMSEENVDMKKVNDLIDEQTALANQMKKLQAEQKVKVKSVLTEEQEMKLRQQRKFRGHQRPGAFRPVSS